MRLILTPQRSLLDVKLVEQLMVMCLDTAPWEEYDFLPILERVSKSFSRVRFRLARADKGTRRPKAPAKQKPRKRAQKSACTSAAEVSSDSSASSDYSDDSSSSSSD